MDHKENNCHRISILLTPLIQAFSTLGVGSAWSPSFSPCCYFADEENWDSKKLHWGHTFWIEVAVLEWKPKLRCFLIFIKARGMQVDRWLTSGSRIYSWADTAWERWYPSTCGHDSLPNVNDDIYMKFHYVCKPHPWVGHAWSKTGWAPVTEVGAVVRETKSTTRCPGRQVGNESKDAVQ